MSKQAATPVTSPNFLAKTIEKSVRNEFHIQKIPLKKVESFDILEEIIVEDSSYLEQSKTDLMFAENKSKTVRHRLSDPGKLTVERTPKSEQIEEITAPLYKYSIFKDRYKWFNKPLSRVAICTVAAVTALHFVLPVNLRTKLEAPVIQAVGLASDNFYRVALATVAQKNKNLDETTGYETTADSYRKDMAQNGTHFGFMDYRLSGVTVSDKQAKECAATFSTQASCGRELMTFGRVVPTFKQLVMGN